MMVIKFSEMYEELTAKNIPRKMLTVGDAYNSDCSDACAVINLKEFQKEVKMADDGFIVNYCLEY